MLLNSRNGLHRSINISLIALQLGVIIHASINHIGDAKLVRARCSVKGGFSNYMKQFVED